MRICIELQIFYVVHQNRHVLKDVSWKDRKAVAADLKTIYRSLIEEAARMAACHESELYTENFTGL